MVQKQYVIMYICQKNLYPIQLPPFFGCSAMCSKEKNFLQECTVHTSTSRIQNPLYKAHDQLSTEGPSTSWRPTTTMSALRSTICSCSISSVKKSSIVTTQNEDSSSISRSSHGRDTDMVLSARSVSNKCVLADFFRQLSTGTLGTILTCMGAGIVGTGGDGAGALQFGSSGCWALPSGVPGSLAIVDALEPVDVFEGPVPRDLMCTKLVYCSAFAKLGAARGVMIRPPAAVAAACISAGASVRFACGTVARKTGATWWVLCCEAPTWKASNEHQKARTKHSKDAEWIYIWDTQQSYRTITLSCW